MVGLSLPRSQAVAVEAASHGMSATEGKARRSSRSDVGLQARPAEGCSAQCKWVEGVGRKDREKGRLGLSKWECATRGL